MLTAKGGIASLIHQDHRHEDEQRNGEQGEAVHRPLHLRGDDIEGARAPREIQEHGRDAAKHEHQRQPEKQEKQQRPEEQDGE